MPKRFMHIAFKFSDGNPKISELKPVFDKAVDWFRYASNCWIVWTSSSAEEWYKRLKPHLTDKDRVFIVAIDPEERQGWMSPSFWDWINKKRTEDE
jgi:hypothetical protein